MSQIEALAGIILEMLNKSADVISAERIEDEDHPVIGVTLTSGEQFFVEVTLP